MYSPGSRAIVGAGAVREKKMPTKRRITHKCCFKLLISIPPFLDSSEVIEQGIGYMLTAK
jgi:hypothetical protein